VVVLVTGAGCGTRRGGLGIEMVARGWWCAAGVETFGGKSISGLDITLWFYFWYMRVGVYM
jgi:hypothetical protein